ncbi:hypothetical protein [Amycolatopsis lurida]|uniref:hypothetical protein n=1 Tax=Amycolatopsis lurida TaxID=31959 RepID=UPI00364821EF
MTYKIDGDLDAILRQSQMISDTVTSLQGVSQRVTGAVVEGVSASRGRWADRLGEVEGNRHGAVTGRVAPAYQEGADGLRAGHSAYSEGDALAASEGAKADFGIANQL